MVLVLFLSVSSFPTILSVDPSVLHSDLSLLLVATDSVATSVFLNLRGSSLPGLDGTLRALSTSIHHAASQHAGSHHVSY